MNDRAAPAPALIRAESPASDWSFRKLVVALGAVYAGSLAALGRAAGHSLVVRLGDRPLVLSGALSDTVGFLMAVSTCYLGYHYLVDAPTGVLLAEGCW